MWEKEVGWGKEGLDHQLRGKTGRYRVLVNESSVLCRGVEARRGGTGKSRCELD